MSSDKIWNNFPGCKCLKSILVRSGFENIASLKLIDSETLINLEKNVEDNRSITSDLTCEHAKAYATPSATSTKFKFLLGHRAIILDWCQNSLKCDGPDTRTDAFTMENPAFSPLLRELIFGALSNHQKPPSSHRFSKVLMEFSIYIFIMAGRACYDILCANLPLPKSGTIVNRIQSHKEIITEGELRSKQLLEYLEKSNATKSVFLSEDASGILKRVSYDSKSNQMIGLVLPINEKNGMPQSKTFIAESAEKMKKYLEGPQSNLVYVVVAQPLQENAAPFILQIYGTNNKFDKNSVSKRWQYTIDELKKLGINVVGISSDGDARLLSIMKAFTSFNSNPSTQASTSATGTTSANQYSLLIVILVQDTIHIGTKLRNRLLNSSIALHIGTKIVSAVHLKILLKTVAEEVHGLVLSDVIPEDKQNFNSLEKIMDDRVLKALKIHVPDSDGTIMYLTLCKLVTSTFISPNLKPIERVYNIWYAVYFLRCWRKWVESNNDYSLDTNFISDNAYTCIEINAQSLIDIIVKLRSNGQDNFFLPHLFASQPCEHIFRMLRSMGTTNYTKINFSLSELLHLIARVEIMQRTRYNCKEIDFPSTSRRVPTHTGSYIMPTLPSDYEIKQAMQNAQKNALEKAAQFGMFFAENDIANTEMAQRSTLSSTKSNFESDELENDSSSDLGSDDEQMEEENTSSPFLHLINPDGTIRKIHKGTFIWMHSEEKDKLSSDRLKRVQGSSRSDSNSSAKRRKKSSGVAEHRSEGSEPGLEPSLERSDEIMIGDWVIFGLKNEIIPSNLEDEIAAQNGHLIGMIIGFRYVNENASENANERSKSRSRQYKSNFVSFSSRDQSEEMIKEKKKKMMALGIWYGCDEIGVLKQISGNLSFRIENYKYTMKSPIIKNGSESISYMLPFQYSKFKNLN